MVEIYISNNVFMHIYAQLDVCSYFYPITVLYNIPYFDFLQMKTDSILMT